MSQNETQTKEQNQAQQMAENDGASKTDSAEAMDKEDAQRDESDDSQVTILAADGISKEHVPEPEGAKNVTEVDKGPKAPPPIQAPDKRERKLTEKMKAFQEEEQRKREHRFHKTYESWKLEIRAIRTSLKCQITEEELGNLIGVAEAQESQVLQVYNDIRTHGSPGQDLKRRMDAAVTRDIMTVMQHRFTEIDEEWNERDERKRLHSTLDRGYSQSVYGSMVQPSLAPSVLSVHSNCSSKSHTASIAAKKADTEVQLAAQKAELQALENEEARKTQLESAIEAQKLEIKRLDAQKAVKVTQAKINAYNQELENSTNDQDGNPVQAAGGSFHEAPDPQLTSSMSYTKHISRPLQDPAPDPQLTSSMSHTKHISRPLQDPTPVPHSRDQPGPAQCLRAEAPAYAPRQAISYTPHSELPSDLPYNQGSTVRNDYTSLAQTLQHSMLLGRLPLPEPTIFNGDPLQYTEWKAAFMTLIDGKGISSQEKFYFLKKYAGKAAGKAIQGFFLSHTEESYRAAWATLEERYGNPFILQRAFRDKLTEWPVISAKDADGLREFADFLQGCQQAIQYIPSLAILDDCMENQRLVAKLPSWASTRWNRKVTEQLQETGVYPTFDTFTKFVVGEARVACNPVSSLGALNESKPTKREPKRKEASVMATATKSENKRGPSQKPQSKDADAQVKNCPFCQSKDHYLPKCSSFAQQSLEARRSFVREQRRCFGCLRVGHASRDCKQKHTCDKCKSKHPTCLHDDNFKVNKEGSSSTNSKDNGNPESSPAAALNTSAQRESFLTTTVVPVWVSTTSNPRREVLKYALLDTQSNTTFLDQGTCEALNAQSTPTKLKLTTMTHANSDITCQRVEGLRVRGYASNVTIDLPLAYTRETIPLDTEQIPTRETAQNWDHLRSIASEIPPLLECNAGLLIGHNCSQALLPREVIAGKDDEPFALRTDLGWSIIGHASPSVRCFNVTAICHRTAAKESPLVTPKDALLLLERDFQDVQAKDKTISQDYLRVLSILRESITMNDEGHYQMPLPFKETPLLPNNRAVAVSRLNQLKRKLQRDPTYHAQYTEYMNTMLERGDAEPVTETVEGSQWFIPHHGVYHPQKQKLRVVFDCSARCQDTSLNDHLLSGPDMANNLLGVLIRFRLHPIAIMGDIEKMFHQFHVSPEHRDFLRFLWWEGGDLDSEPKEFRMRVHLFGATSSPSCANFALKHLAKENKLSLPLGANFIERNFYVDDGLTSESTVERALEVINEARTICAEGNLRLHKFVSNNRAVMEGIPQTERASNVQRLDLSLENLPAERALGLQWSVEEDKFFFAHSPNDRQPTRRNMLATVASLYDPLGLIAPYILRELNPVSEVQLHHFADASTTGYGTCTYIRVKNETSVHCSLVLAKARVAPTKVTTIPRLELSAALVSAEVSAVLKEELDLVIAQEYFWTDSRVVLGYLNNAAKKFHIFVANRVQKIRELTDPKQWQYVPTDANPADHASRGLSANELANTNWFSGPSFLWEEDLAIPHQPTTQLQSDDPEVKSKVTLQTRTSPSFDWNERLAHCSTWNKASHSVARIMRLRQRVKGQHNISADELRKAELLIIKGLQRQAFPHEYKCLAGRNSLPKTSTLHPLDAFLDDGIIRVGGRLQGAPISLGQKHPILLPKHGHITELIIDHFHKQIKHQGRGMTLNSLRSNGFWIIGGSRAVANHIHRCVICRKLRRPGEEQKMADLPKERLDPSPPFTHTGMDCFGPFMVKNGRKEAKRYGLLFTCFCSRAIHLEVLDDLSTDAFINGLRCFIALRGSVRQIRSDQGTNFTGADNEFKAALKEMTSDRMQQFLAANHCKFVFNAPGSSHAGGVWERQIRSVRSVLNATISLCPGRLDDSSLRTLFYEAMSIVNSRPLTVANINDPTAPEPLTPNHIITMKPTIPLPPPGEFVKQDLYLRKRWRRVQFLSEQFWARWKHEYFNNIIQRQKWHKPRRNITVGDIVLVADPTATRNEWPLGRVIEVMKGDDGLVRKVKMHIASSNLDNKGKRKTALSVLERPIQKVILLIEAD